LIEAAHHLDFQVGAGPLKLQELTGIARLKLRRGGFPVGKPLAPILDLLDQRIE